MLNLAILIRVGRQCQLLRKVSLFYFKVELLQGPQTTQLQHERQAGAHVCLSLHPWGAVLWLAWLGLDRSSATNIGHQENRGAHILCVAHGTDKRPLASEYKSQCDAVLVLSEAAVDLSVSSAL